MKYVLYNVDSYYDIGEIHFIPSRDWFDGPQEGVLTAKYQPSEQLESFRELRNGKLNGISQFFNEEGHLTQLVFFENDVPNKIFVREGIYLKEVYFQYDHATKTIIIKM